MPTRGKATGIDIWHAIAGQQSLEKLRRNAEIENVLNRIEFREADARQMSFDNGAFDVVFDIKTRLHASAINVMRPQKRKKQKGKGKPSPKTQVPQQPEDHETAV